jgi:hypothetical protein
MKIKPEFTVNGLEFSETLCDTYTWDGMMAINWPDGWRAPKKWELMMLYEEAPNSHSDHSYWSASSVTSDNWGAWDVNFYGGYENRSYTRSRHHVRLVRGINQ